MMRTWTWMIWRTTMRKTSMRHWAEIQPVPLPSASAQVDGASAGPGSIRQSPEPGQLVVQPTEESLKQTISTRTDFPSCDANSGTSISFSGHARRRSHHANEDMPRRQGHGFVYSFHAQLCFHERSGGQSKDSRMAHNSPYGQ